MNIVRPSHCQITKMQFYDFASHIKSPIKRRSPWVNKEDFTMMSSPSFRRLKTYRSIWKSQFFVPKCTSAANIICRSASFWDSWRGGAAAVVAAIAPSRRMSLPSETERERERENTQVHCFSYIEWWCKVRLNLYHRDEEKTLTWFNDTNSLEWSSPLRSGRDIS